MSLGHPQRVLAKAFVPEMTAISARLAIRYSPLDTNPTVIYDLQETQDEDYSSIYASVHRKEEKHEPNGNRV